MKTNADTKTVLLLAAFILMFTACKQASDEKPNETPAKRHEIARLIKTTVLIRDTTGIAVWDDKKDTKIDLYISYRYLNYLEPSYLNEFRQDIYRTSQSREALVYGINWDLLVPLTPAQIRNRLIKCDSVTEIGADAKGNEILNKVFRCDSVSTLTNIIGINFYETWSIDETTKMISKDILAYEPVIYNQDKNYSTPLFIILKDENSRKKLLKLMPN